jgi:hypothetical protein
VGFALGPIIAGLGLVLWSIIEAPVYGWSSALVIGVGVGGLAVLGGFTAWEWVTSHPMLNLRFFRLPSFSAPIGSLGLAMFGLVGSLFVLTQFLQFNLGYSALQAGVRMLPMAGAMAGVAPLSSIAVRRAGTKLTVAAGLLLIGAGLWQTSDATMTWTFLSVLPGMLLAGIGAALVIPAVSGSVMNSLPHGHTGVGSATNGVSIQVGGALGVAAQIGGLFGRLLAGAARSAFISGGDLGMFTAAMVALAGCVVALVTVPSRPRALPESEAPDTPEPKTQDPRATEP